MKIWEAIIYGLIGGVTELLPVSFTGHYALLKEIFGLSSLSEGAGLYIRIAICLGVILAICFSLRRESAMLGREALCLSGLKRRRRGQQADRAYVRSVLVFSLALAMMLLSLIYRAKAERQTGLVYVAAGFAINGLLLHWFSRGRAGEKTETNVLVSDAFLIGAARMASVFPGLSGLSSSLFVGEARGLSFSYNARVAYMLTLSYEVLSLVYHLVRAVLYGSFPLEALLPFAIVLALTAAVGYLAMHYFRYLVIRKKLGIFAYYCWDAAMIALVVALINA